MIHRNTTRRPKQSNTGLSQQPNTSWTQGETQLMSRSLSEESRHEDQNKVTPVLANSGTRVGLNGRPSSIPGRDLKNENALTKTKCRRSEPTARVELNGRPSSSPGRDLKNQTTPTRKKCRRSRPPVELEVLDSTKIRLDPGHGIINLGCDRSP
jgi:hypothetical protein